MGTKNWCERFQHVTKLSFVTGIELLYLGHTAGNLVTVPTELFRPHNKVSRKKTLKAFGGCRMVVVFLTHSPFLSATFTGYAKWCKARNVTSQHLTTPSVLPGHFPYGIRQLPEKLNISQISKIVPEFYDKRSFFAVFKKPANSSSPNNF
jgi:hypothetical protein